MVTGVLFFVSVIGPCAASLCLAAPFALLWLWVERSAVCEVPSGAGRKVDSPGMSPARGAQGTRLAGPRDSGRGGSPSREGWMALGVYLLFVLAAGFPLWSLVLPRSLGLWIWHSFDVFALPFPRALWVASMSLPLSLASGLAVGGIRRSRRWGRVAAWLAAVLCAVTVGLIAREAFVNE